MNHAQPSLEYSSSEGNYVLSSAPNLLQYSALRHELDSKRLRAEAIFLSNFGRVLPLEPDGKRPLIQGGLTNASDRGEDINEWWDHWPRANIGMVLEDLLVIDNDNPKHDGTTAATDSLDAPTVRTPSGGTHTYFIKPSGFRKRLCVNHIDFLTGSSYVLMPPSVIGGKPYTWESGSASSLGSSLVEPSKSQLRGLLPSAVLYNKSLDLSSIGEGNRNNTLYSLGCRLRAFHYPEMLVELMVEFAAKAMPGDFEDEEVERIHASLRSHATRAEASMWLSPVDQLDEKQLDHKIALLLGVLRGANAGPALLEPCLYAVLSYCTITFDVTADWISRRVHCGMKYPPNQSHFLRRAGSADRGWRV